VEAVVEKAGERGDRDGKSIGKRRRESGGGRGRVWGRYLGERVRWLGEKGGNGGAGLGKSGRQQKRVVEREWGTRGKESAEVCEERVSEPTFYFFSGPNISGYRNHAYTYL
jgi:hypothetical protein